MKKRIPLLILYFSFFAALNTGFTQNFAPVGAVWHVGIYDIFWNNHYGTIVSVGDTIIENKACKIIEIPGTCNLLPSPQYMYVEDEKLYYYSEVDLENPDSMKFKLLADFGADVGESWTFEFWNPAPSLEQTREAIVDSISYFYYNNGMDSLRIQHITFDPPITFFDNYRVIENLGFSDGLFPDMSVMFPCDASGIFETRCYEDENLGFLKFVDYACNFTGTEDLEAQESFTLIPNPAYDFLRIETVHSGVIKYQIFSSDGRQWRLQDNFIGQTAIDVSNLPNGIYYIQLLTPESIVVKPFHKL